MYGAPSSAPPSHSPLRMEGFAVPGSSGPLSISPHMLHSHFGGGLDNGMSGGGGGGGGMTMAELAELESFMCQDHGNAAHSPRNEPEPHSFADGTASFPLSSLPRHLDVGSSRGPSPMSPTMQSPGSTSTSAGLSGTDFFPDGEYSSFSDDMSTPPHAKDFGGKRRDRFLSTSKAPSGCSHSGRMSGYGSPPIGYQALSVPTYLSAVRAPSHLASSAPWGPGLPAEGGVGSSALSASLYAHSGRPATRPDTATDSAASRLASFTPASHPVTTSVARFGLDRQDVGGQNRLGDEKQAAVMSEKRRRRRESHNAVERRRRDNINDRIQELSTLLPDFMLDQSTRGALPATLEDAADESSGDANAAAQLSPQAAAAAAKPNKGIILSKSVDYIRLLIQRNAELEQMVRRLRSGNSAPSSFDLDVMDMTLEE